MVTSHELGAAQANGAAPAPSDSEVEHIAADAAARAADQAERKEKEKITLSNGIELKVRKVAPLTLKRAQENVAVPVAPMMDGGSGRQVPNEDHPDYVRAVEKYNEAIGMAVVDTLIILGTEIISVPDGLPKIDDTDWAEELEFVGVTVAPEGRRRYLDYLRFYALADITDLAQVVDVVGRSAGLQEGDVWKAIDTFRRDQGRSAAGGGES